MMNEMFGTQHRLRVALINTRNEITRLLLENPCDRDRKWEQARDNLYSMEQYYLEEFHKLSGNHQADALINNGIAPERPGFGQYIKVLLARICRRK